MTRIKLLFSFNYWKYIFSIKKFLNSILNTLGIIWLFVEATSFFSESLSLFFKQHWIWLLVLGIIYVIYINWPRNEFSFKLKNKDVKIVLIIQDLFKIKGDLVIPINTSFDTSFEGDLISKDSTQGQFTIKFFKEPRYLEQDLASELQKLEGRINVPTKTNGNNFKYEIGATIKLKTENFLTYLVAVADMNNHGVAATTFDNVLTSLAKLWDFVSNRGEVGIINIPLLGTGKGRIKESRETIVKAIVTSFISSTIGDKRFCDRLNIVIHPKDFIENNINIDDLCDYLSLKCNHHES